MTYKCKAGKCAVQDLPSQLHTDSGKNLFAEGAVQSQIQFFKACLHLQSRIPHLQSVAM